MKPLDPSEYSPYHKAYLDVVPDDDILATIASQLETIPALLKQIPEERGVYAYAPGKWSIKQLIGHMSDTERIFAYRALRIGRNDVTPLAGFEQDDYIAGADFNARPLQNLIEEFIAIRQSSLALFNQFTAEELLRRGTANGSPISVRALAYITAGHAEHHVRILKSRYVHQ